MRKILSTLIVACALCACGGPSGSGGDGVAEIDLSPHPVAVSRAGWQVVEGGLAERSGGLYIDLAHGGQAVRRIQRAVGQGHIINLNMRIDATGDQNLEIELAGGCSRAPGDDQLLELVNLKNGFNRVSVSGSLTTPHECIELTLRAFNGPVSLYIGDATLTWSLPE